MKCIKPACLWLCVICCALFASACQRSPAPQPPAARQEVSLLHYLSFSGSFADTMDQLAADFNRGEAAHLLHPAALDHESFKVSILDDLHLHHPADLYSYWGGARVQAIVEDLAPIDDVLPQAKMQDLFGKSVVDSVCTYKGRIYFLPVTQHLIGFFYNKKILAEQGLVPPQTWDEFLHMGSVLKARGIAPVALGSKARWPAQFWFDYLLLRTAGLEYRQKLLAGQASFQDAEVKKVFALWRDLLKAGFFNAHPNELEFDTGAAAMVQRGEAAMTLIGTWIMGYYDSPEQHWKEDEDYGFFAFPQINPAIAPIALGVFDGLVMPREARNPEGAKKVLEFFSRSTTQQTLSRAMGSIVPAVGSIQAPTTQLRQDIQAEIKRASAWAFNYDLSTSPARAEIGLNLFTEFLEFPDQYPLLLERSAQHMAQLTAEKAP